MDVDPDEVRPLFDHLIVMVDDPGPIREHLAAEWGLHVHADSLRLGDGVANLLVPLEPPQYLEILYVEDRATFEMTQGSASSDPMARGGLIGWALRTWDMAALELALGQKRNTIASESLVDGSAPPWSTLSKDGDPLGYPFYIEYATNARDRLGRWQQRLAEVAHDVAPSGIHSVEVSGPDVVELRAWLAPAAHLDIRIVEGPRAIRAAIEVGQRLMRLSSDTPGGIVTD